MVWMAYVSDVADCSVVALKGQEALFTSTVVSSQDVGLFEPLELSLGVVDVVMVLEFMFNHLTLRTV